MSQDIKLGKHKLSDRNDFIERKTAKYLQRHPEVSRKKARKYAKVKWARKVNTELASLKHVNKMRVSK
jgi:hypothetical protein